MLYCLVNLVTLPSSLYTSGFSSVDTQLSSFSCDHRTSEGSESPVNNAVRYIASKLTLIFTLIFMSVITTHLEETLPSTCTFVKCTGLCAAVFHHYIFFFVLSNVPAENLYYMFRQKNPHHKCYSEYTSLSFEKMLWKTGTLLIFQAL